MDNEKSLIIEVLNGDDSKFSILYKQNREIVFKSIFLIIKDDAVSKDVLQETFIKAYHNLGKFNHRSKFSTWLLRIAYNLCYDHLKKEKRRRKVFDDISAEKGNYHFSDYDKAEFKNIVIQCIYELPIVYREIIFLYYVNEKSYKEIGLELDIPLGTVKTYLHRGKNKLHLKLKRIYEKGIR